MTNDSTETETRLRDYLETKARTVQGDEAPLQLDSTSRHRSWPALAAVAAVIAVVGLIVPSVLRLGDGDDPAPEALSAPGPVQTVPGGKSGAVKATPLQVPFLLDTPDLTDQTSVLHDGATRVNAPKVPYIVLVGRAANGWVIRLGNSKTAVALLARDGRWRQLSADADWAFLSPDKTQVALSRREGETNRLVVVEIATGRELYMLPANHPRVQVYGWNADGIWFSEYHEPDNAPQPYLWTPGSDPRLIPALGFAGLQAPATTDRIALRTETTRGRCTQVVTVRDDSFVPLREHCTKAEADPTTLYSFLSPRGDVLAFPDARLALQVGTGVMTRLNGLAGSADPTANEYEDADHLLVKSQGATPSQSNGLDAEIVSRCNVRTGSCRVIYHVEDRHAIHLGTP